MRRSGYFSVDRRNRPERLEAGLAGIDHSFEEESRGRRRRRRRIESRRGRRRRIDSGARGAAALERDPVAADGPDGLAFGFARTRSDGSNSATNSSSGSAPAPTSTSAPTSRRTIFQRKCDATIRTSTSSPAVATSQRSTTTIVEVCSSGFSQKLAKSCRPAMPLGGAPHRLDVERAAAPTRRTAWRAPSAGARSGRRSCARWPRGGRESARAPARRARTWMSAGRRSSTSRAQLGRANVAARLQVRDLRRGRERRRRCGPSRPARPSLRRPFRAPAGALRPPSGRSSAPASRDSGSLRTPRSVDRWASRV